jgi:hypothetical protein
MDKIGILAREERVLVEENFSFIYMKKKKYLVNILEF